MSASLLTYKGERFKAGDIAYLRVAVRGFAEDWDGVRRAVCEPVDRKGNPDPEAHVQVYSIDEAILSESKIVAEDEK